MTIKDIQDIARVQAPIFKDKTPEQRMLYLASELGEVAQEVLKLGGFRKGGDTEALKRNLGMEIYDVVWNLCDLANMLDIDLEESFAAKIKHNEERWKDRLP